MISYTSLSGYYNNTALDSVKLESKKLLTRVITACALTALAALPVYVSFGGLVVGNALVSSFSIIKEIAMFTTIQFLFERATSYLIGLPHPNDTASERFLKNTLPIAVSIIGSCFAQNYFNNRSLDLDFLEKIYEPGEFFDEYGYNYDVLMKAEYWNFEQSACFKLGTEVLCLSFKTFALTTSSVYNKIRIVCGF